MNISDIVCLLIRLGHLIANFRMNGSKRAVTRKMWDANAETAKMVTPHGKNHAVGHSMTHHGHLRMLILFNVNHHHFNLHVQSMMAKRSTDTIWCIKIKLFTSTMKLAWILNLMKIHMKTGQIFSVPIKILSDQSQQTADMPLEVAFQQFLSDQARINYTSAVLSVPMVMLAGTRENIQPESGLTWRSRNVSKKNKY